MKIKKKKWIGNFFFFFLGKKSHKSHWERGRISAAEDTKKKKSLIFSLFLVPHPLSLLSFHVSNMSGYVVYA